MDNLVFLIPILALSIPVAGVVFHGLQKIAQTRLEEARVRAGALDKGTEAEVAALRDEVGELRRELGDVQERLDFTERVLSQSRQAERIPGHRES